MQERLTIRKARVDEAPKISELILGVARYFNSNPSGEIAEWFVACITPPAIAAYIEDPRINYLVGLVEQSLAGVVAIRDNSHVQHLFVAPEYQRQGVATRLWQRAKADAIASGNKGVFSVKSSEYAVPVYERFGFRVVGARTDKDGIAFVPMSLESYQVHG
jgi:ribosomal protein S18 acetylase RimI-like enzyme